jgi:hypothetical protein
MNAPYTQFCIPIYHFINIYLQHENAHGNSNNIDERITHSSLLKKKKKKKSSNNTHHSIYKIPNYRILLFTYSTNYQFFYIDIH